MNFELRHLQKKRKHIKSKPAKSNLDRLVYVAAIIAPSALVPQVYKLFTTHDASALSLPTWAILGCMNCLWFSYGIHHREPPIVITNFLLAILNTTIVVGILLYR